MKIIKNRYYVNSFASTSDIEALENRMTKIVGEVASSSAASWAQEGNADLIPSDKLPSYVDDVVEVDQLPEEGESGKIYIYENKQYRWSGTEFIPIESGGVVIGTITGTAYDGGKGTELEGRVSVIETINDKVDGLISEVGDSLQVGKADKDLNLNTTDNKVMINSYGTVIYSTPYPGDETRQVVQFKNNDQLSGVTTTGAGVPLIFMSKWDKVEVGGSGAPLNLNTNGNVTINDDKIVATTDQIPGTLPNPNALTIKYNGTQAVTYDGSEAETGNFIVDATTVPMSQEDSTTLSEKFDEYAKKDEILDAVVKEDTNETLRQSLTSRTHLPFAVANTTIENKTEAQIFEYFDSSVTDRVSLRNYLQSNMAYIAYNFDSLGHHQYYKLSILLASIPDSGDISIIAIGPDIYNSDILTKFTYTITLNGDSSSVVINKKVLEN